jgi:hypothetical protein
MVRTLNGGLSSTLRKNRKRYVGLRNVFFAHQPGSVETADASRSAHFIQTKPATKQKFESSVTRVYRRWRVDDSVNQLRTPNVFHRSGGDETGAANGISYLSAYPLTDRTASPKRPLVRFTIRSRFFGRDGPDPRDKARHTIRTQSPGVGGTVALQFEANSTNDKIARVQFEPNYG